MAHNMAQDRADVPATINGAAGPLGPEPQSTTELVLRDVRISIDNPNDYGYPQPMTANRLTELDREIAALESDLASLRKAREVMGRRAPSKPKLMRILTEVEIGRPGLRVRKRLSQLCIDALSQAPEGLMPADIIRYCLDMEHGFKNSKSASATVGTALRRLVDRGQVVRRDGRYYLVGDS